MIAVLYDVHGNLPALEAVLEDAARAGVREHVLGGDYALFGPWPAETVARLRELDQARWIRGNGERWTAHPDEAPDNEFVQGAIAASREALGQAAVDELGGLPESLRTDAGVLFVHGSPVSDVESFGPAAGEDDRRLLGDAGDSERIVFGHTHVQFRRIGPAGVSLLNPGSVGMPFDGDTRAAYAILGEGQVECRRVEYDHEASAAAARERLPGFGEQVARRIERAAFDV